MGVFRALGLASVRKDAIEAALAQQGLGWSNVAHVCATASLAGELRHETKVVALPIASLIDLVVMPGWPDGLGLPIDGFPGPDQIASSTTYDEMRRAWQDEASGRRVRLGIEFDDHLRAFVRERYPGSMLGASLNNAHREFSLTLHTLIQSGLEPSDVAGEDPLTRMAAEAWAFVEEKMPVLTRVRDDLWMDAEEFSSVGTKGAADLRRRVLEALDKAFGQAHGTRTLVLHGFYFYTPQQWALFQLLRQFAEVDQIFIVHDDGVTPVFQVWRDYFSSEWLMPVPEPVVVPAKRTAAATSFAGALSGTRVDPAQAVGVTILECRSPAELVRQWRLEESSDGKSAPRYAGDAQSVERFAQRIGKESSGGSSLADLPIGAFLLALHDCIVVSPGVGPVIHFSGSALLDMIASGYLLPEEQGSAQHLASVFDRCQPYFTGCSKSAQWIARAERLAEVTSGPVASRGGRETGDSDVARIAKAVGNPLRLVPWGDLTIEEADTLLLALRRAHELAAGLASTPRLRLRKHANFLREYVERGLKWLPEDARKQLTHKVEGFAAGLDQEIDVEGLAEIVSMLLGRSSGLVLDEQSDEGERMRVKPLRNLDVLGFRRSEVDVHLANLAEGIFPSASDLVGWPFTYDSLTGSHAEDAYFVTVGLLRQREKTSQHSDLYLLWLALDGVEETNRLTLSWIREVQGEPRKLSPLVSLIAQHPGLDPELSERMGGVAVDHVPAGGDLPAIGSWIPPVASTDDLGPALAAVDPRALASAYICPRRTALQWLVGPSAAFQPEFQQGMLFGNVRQLLRRQSKSGTGLEAFATTDALWPQLTDGQRRSSEVKAVIPVKGGGADPTWLLTLGGAKDPHWPRPVDRAYKAAREQENPPTEVVVPNAATYLPLVESKHELCKECPVQSRCRLRADRDD